MRSESLATLGTWFLVLTGLGANAWGVLVPPGRSLPETERREAAISRVLDPAPYAAESLGEVAVGHDLFRSDRRAAAVAYDPTRGAVPATGTPVKPVLVLSGIVWGSVPEAVVEGLPGADGPRVMRVGDVVARLVVKRIEPAQVVILGMDTTWSLKVREPWR